MFAFTIEPEERYLLVHVSFKEGEKRRPSLGSARDVKKAMLLSVKSMLGELACVELDVLVVNDLSRTCIVCVSDKNQMRAAWFAITCVDNLGGVQCVLRVVKVSSTLLGVAPAKRTGN
jgi:RNase P/RNase MRP subunit POP5